MNEELQRLVDIVDQGRSDAAEAWARPRAEKGEADAQFLMGYLMFGEKRVRFPHGVRMAPSCGSPGSRRGSVRSLAGQRVRRSR